MKLYKGTKHKINNLLLLFAIFTVSTFSFAQNSPFKTIQFNVPVGGTIKNSCGLEVKGVLVSNKIVSISKATLSDEPTKHLDKREFILGITITNKGTSDIIISDWTFHAICPENNHGQQWNETSFVNLTTPYIPNNTNIVLKPGEKKEFNTTATDFYWCLPKHDESLKTLPCGFKAIIICSQLGAPINNTSNDGFFGNNCPTMNYEEANPLDPELLALIEDFKKAQASGNTIEASEVKKNILEIAGHAYPDQIDEIKALLLESPLKTNPITTVNSTSTKTATTNNLGFTDWLTIKNPYYAMQVRYKLEKQEGDIGYFRTQMRIDYEDKDRCKTERCLGYVVSFGYPTLEEKSYIYLNYKFYYPYKEIYTVPNLIPIKLSIPDGSKRMLKQDGFYYTTKSNPQEMDLRYYFDKAVDLILEGSPIKVNNFNESKATILK